jgi:hypothetical protein
VRTGGFNFLAGYQLSPVDFCIAYGVGSRSAKGLTLGFRYIEHWMSAGMRQYQASLLIMATHAQTWVKVNAPIDVKIAELISLLNRVEGLETLQSCQGDPGERQGYIYFALDGWQNLCRFVFEGIAPRIKDYLGEDVKLEIVAGERPMARMSFSAEAVPIVTSALKEVVS